MRARVPAVVAIVLAVIIVGAGLGYAAAGVAAQVTLTQISSDPYTGDKAQHATEVEATRTTGAPPWWPRSRLAGTRPAVR